MGDVKDADAWNELWGRVTKLDAIGHSWIFSGLERERTRSYSGPWVQKSGKAYLRLFELVGEQEDLIGYVSFDVGASEPFYITTDDQEELPLPFATLDATKDEYIFPEDLAGRLWRDYLARADTMWKLWIEHVAHWQSQNIAPIHRYTQGISMHGRGHLYLIGYNSYGRAILEFSYPALSGPMPRVIYTEHYDAPIEESSNHES